MVADIRKNGQFEPIVLFEGKILDGRNRYQACAKLGIEPNTIEWSGCDTVEDFVISKNLSSRHLNESQRAMVSARLAICRHGGDRRSDQAANLPLCLSLKKAAEKTNISERSARTAATVIAKGDPALIAAVDSGKIRVSAAADIADQPKARQRELVSADKYSISKSVKRIRKNKATQQARAEKPAATQKKTRNGHDPIDLCAMEVRRIVLGAMTEMSPEGAGSLIAELREELDDIAKVAERRRAAKSPEVTFAKLDVISPPDFAALPTKQLGASTAADDLEIPSFLRSNKTTMAAI